MQYSETGGFVYYQKLSSRAATIVEDLPQDEMVNMGIAIVVPATKILEVINQQMIKDADDKDESE